jgi:hypothetical protein
VSCDATAIVGHDAGWVEAIVSGATPEMLLVALDGDATAGEYFGDGITRYRCPSCQGAGWTPAREAPTVIAVDALAVECGRCGPLTRWYLQRSVLEDLTAVVRLVGAEGETTR